MEKLGGRCNNLRVPDGCTASLLLVAVAVALCHHSSRLVNAAVWASRGEEKGEPAGRLGFLGLDRMRLLLALVLFAKSLLRTTGCLASRMLR